MGVNWPEASKFPFQVTSTFSWAEIGAVLRLIDENKIGLVIETGVNQGDIAAWMLALCAFNPVFAYVGITCDPEGVEETVKEYIKNFPQAFISRGLSYSDEILRMVKKYINNSYATTMVLCDGAHLEKEFSRYMSILRPGDVICVSGFPVRFPMNSFTSLERDEKIRRITAPWISQRTRLIAGVVL